MKNKILDLGLIMSIFLAFQLPSLADNNIAANSKSSTRNIVNITPFNLVSSAYQGQFTNFDIPSHLEFLTAVQTNKIDSKILVKSAIESGRLEPKKINERGLSQSSTRFTGS